jgi:hypothetical protein
VQFAHDAAADLSVIASEAKQSIFRLGKLWIASSLALLAMTRKEQHQSARRANQQISCPALAQKIFRFPPW